MGLRLGDGFDGRGDDAYAALMRAHDGLSDAESDALNACLVLLLANHIGDLATLEEAARIAREAAVSDRAEPA